MTAKYIYKVFLGVFALGIGLSISSCQDDNVGEYKLKGDISDLIPANSYKLTDQTTSDGRFWAFEPSLSSSFVYWGLNLTQVDYYIDDKHFSTQKSAPFMWYVKKSDLEVGKHLVKAVLTIKGEECNDLTLETTAEIEVKDDDLWEPTPGDFYIDYNYVRKGEYLYVTPELISEHSFAGCKIDQVDYYIDFNLVSTATEAPYRFDYLVTESAGKSIILKVDIFYHDNNNASLRYTRNEYIKVRSDSDEDFTCMLKSSRCDYTNGQTLSFVAKYFKGTASENKNIEFKLDGELIGSSSEFPYTLNYKLEGLSVGIHKVECTQYIQTTHSVSNGTTTSSHTSISKNFNFIITK